MTASLTTLNPLNLNTTADYTFGNVTATGNVSGTYVIGNGSQLTGLPASYANADVATYLASGTNTSNIVVTGNISGSYFIGNGSQLTGISSGGGTSNVSIRAQAMTMSIILGS